VVRYSVRVVFDTGHSHFGENHKSTRVDTNKRAKDRPTKQAKDAKKAWRIFGSEDFFACLVGNGWQLRWLVSINVYSWLEECLKRLAAGMKMETPFFCEKYIHRQKSFVSLDVYLWFKKFSNKVLTRFCAF
jgi:hypothetical protein